MPCFIPMYFVKEHIFKFLVSVCYDLIVLGIQFTEGGRH